MTRLLSTKQLPALAGILLAMILAVSLVPLNALANDSLQTQETIVAQGTCGDCNWTINDEGNLLVKTKSATDNTLESFSFPAHPGWTYTTNQVNEKVISAEFGYGVKANTNLSGLFNGCSEMVRADLSKLDTANTTNMDDMFKGCKSLEYVNLSGLDTAKVTTMSGMFDGCTSLKTVTLGAGFKFIKGCTLPEGEWRSQEDGQVYTAAAIAADRNGKADTYTKVDPNEKPNPENPNQGDNSGSNTPGGSSKGKNVYRLYNPNNGDHFYTTSAVERDWLKNDIGWIYEEVAWVAPETGGEVYRLYNPNNGDHLYTTSASERDWLKNKIGWIYEGICWHTADSNGTPLYRLFNPNVKIGCHLWTSSVAERDWLKDEIGWIYEEVAWYALAQ